MNGALKFLGVCQKSTKTQCILVSLCNLKSLIKFKNSLYSRDIALTHCRLDITLSKLICVCSIKILAGEIEIPYNSQSTKSILSSSLIYIYWHFFAHFCKSFTVQKVQCDQGVTNKPAICGLDIRRFRDYRFFICFFFVMVFVKKNPINF